MTADKLNMARTALIIVDLQNDFLHPDGAYARGGAKLSDADHLVTRMAAVADAMRQAGGLVIATQFTLVPGRGGEPMISPHLARLRPFLRRGDFHPGSWGQAPLDALGPVDILSEKVAYSAFYMSRLEFVLRKAGIDNLLIGGIVTNGGVASTLRDAHVRDFQTWLITDACAAFSRTAHEASLTSLGTVTPCLDSAAAVQMIAAS